MHVPGHELCPGRDRRGVEGGDSEADEGGADGGGGQDGDKPRDALECDCECEVDHDRAAFAHEHVEGREEDAAQCDT